MLELDHIYNMDYLQGIKEIPSKSIDLIITDPPYVCEKCGGAPNSEIGNRVPNKRILHLIKGFDINACFEEFVRIAKTPNFIIFCSNKQISSIMKWFEDRGLVTTLLVWVKTNPIPLANMQYMSDLEYVVYVRGDKATFNTDVPIGLKKKAYISSLTKSMEDDVWHPTQKPVDLIRRYILVHSKEGDTIFDPFMGSATTAIACIREKRHFLGFESDKTYYDRACKRINDEQKQLTLF